MAKRSRRRVLRQRERSEHGFCSTSSSGYDDDDESSTDTDEEYFKIIAGEDDAEDPQEQDPEEVERLRKLRIAFDQADDGDGTLTLAEVRKMQGLLSADASTERMEKLEKQVTDNTKKLDRILALLEKTR